ncbi:YopX family protein [Lactiplantibacillus plantarum]|uniref:YopX family protein n=2 Tax=Lactiplantibacillus plantarum TaxID=1590 RepID=UPI0021CB35A9|nr:YopX family protein [Lactiplantibacillus plantarum]WND31616.1 YopX family protein [Lactiplantibacillus plantarum]
MATMIKFRVWNKDLSKYRKLDDISNDQGLGMFFEVQKGIGSNVTSICYSINDVVEQFTGLKDKHGVEIYEGDIVHGYDQEPDRDDGYIGSSVVEVVKFEEGAFWLGGIKYRILVGTPPIIEVIGNIHENPELLEE